MTAATSPTALSLLQSAFDQYAAVQAVPLQQQIDALSTQNGSLTAQVAAQAALLSQDDAALATAKQQLAAEQVLYANLLTADTANVAQIANLQQQIAALQAQLASAQPGKAPAPPAGYAVAFQDDFNGSMSSTWTATTDAASNELSQRLPANVVAGPGHLSVVAKRETYGSRQFTSGYVTTAGKESVPVGRWLARMRWTDLYGMWPAFWLRDDSGPGEIDGMEAVGTWPHLAFTVHQNTAGTQDKSGTDWPWPAGWKPSDWHVYGVERQKDGTVIWTLDGTVVKTERPTDFDNQKQVASWLAGSSFAGALHLIINLQVGGSMPNSILGTLDQSKILPAGTIGSLDIDYVQILTPIGG